MEFISKEEVLEILKKLRPTGEVSRWSNNECAKDDVLDTIQMKIEDLQTKP